jgi:DNA-binding transcriptional MerR regulator
MKSSFSIGEISELLGIPKSTLRYWESEGLISMPRDDENNYRKYNPSSIYTVSDLAHYRCLRMSLQDMKRLPSLSPLELADTLTTLDQNLDQKLKELYLAKEYINRKMDCIEEYKRLSQFMYRQEEPDYNNIYLFSIDDTDAWSVYIKDQYQSILLYDAEKNTIETGLAIPTAENHPKLWELDRRASYLSFVLKVEYSNPSIDDFMPHVQELTNSGHQVSKILARYLFSACDGKYYDYYKAFAELTNNPGL